MKLYYTPGACSLADHIAFEETGLPYTLEKVDIRAKRTESGRDFTEINPKGYVPALELDDGQILTENVALLAYIADQAGQLMPEGLDRFRVLSLLSFIGSEIHHTYTPFFRNASDEDKTAAGEKLGQRYAQVAREMGGRAFAVGDALSVADLYLFVTLTWAEKMGVAVPDALQRYAERIKARPAVQKALAQEGLA